MEFHAGAVGVSGLWTQAPRPAAVLVLAHGAGAGMNHPFMTGVAEALAAGGVSVLRFNFPYMQRRRRIPDAVSVLLETWSAAIRHAIGLAPGLPVVAAGKSFGGRIASMLAAAQGESFPGSALVFFGYPLHAPGKIEQLRDAHFPMIRIPMLFIQGTRDAFARLDLIEEVVKKLQPLARLHLVTGGDHSFRVPGAHRSDRENGQFVGRVALDYLPELLVAPARPGG